MKLQNTRNKLEGVICTNAYSTEIWSLRNGLQICIVQRHCRDVPILHELELPVLNKFIFKEMQF